MGANRASISGPREGSLRATFFVITDLTRSAVIIEFFVTYVINRADSYTSSERRSQQVQTHEREYPLNKPGFNATGKEKQIQKRSGFGRCVDLPEPDPTVAILSLGRGSSARI